MLHKNIWLPKVFFYPNTDFSIYRNTSKSDYNRSVLITVLKEKGRGVDTSNPI